MRKIHSVHTVGKWLGWVSAGLVAVLTITGFGITQFRVFNTITFGLWNKAASLFVHTTDWIPVALIFTLGLHIGLALLPQKRNET
jgi:hypothetical protein